MVLGENVFLAKFAGVQSVTSQSPFPLFHFYLYKLKGKEGEKWLSRGRKRSWQDNSCVCAAERCWMQVAAEHKVYVVD